MTTRALGVAIGRRAGGAVGPRSPVQSLQSKVGFQVVRDRSASDGIGETLRRILESVPQPLRKLPLHVALSPSVLACADVLTRPQGVKPHEIPQILPTLCEARCAGETAEEVEVDSVTFGDSLQTVAIKQGVIGEIREIAGELGFRVELVTAIPLVLAKGVEGDLDITWGGEKFVVHRDLNGGGRGGPPVLAWRAYPVDVDVARGGLPVRIHGVDVPVEQAAAFAAAMADPEEVPNLLNGVPDAPRTFGERFRGPLIAAGAAAGLALGVLGFRLHRVAEAEKERLSQARNVEQELWKKHLPSYPSKEGGLLGTMKLHLKDVGDGQAAAEIPSALAFWAEVGKHLPEPDPLGMTLESMDITPEEGRISVRVETKPNEPFGNAALLENRLNESTILTARGDYEMKGSEVVMRMRLGRRTGLDSTPRHQDTKATKTD